MHTLLLLKLRKSTEITNIKNIVDKKLLPFMEESKDPDFKQYLSSEYDPKTDTCCKVNKNGIFDWFQIGGRFINSIQTKYDLRLPIIRIKNIEWEKQVEKAKEQIKSMEEPLQKLFDKLNLISIGETNTFIIEDTKEAISTAIFELCSNSFLEYKYLGKNEDEITISITKKKETPTTVQEFIDENYYSYLYCGEHVLELDGTLHSKFYWDKNKEKCITNKDWYKTFYTKFIENEDPYTIIVLVDCHY